MPDFSDVIDISGIFTDFELDTGVDFVDTGDLGAIIISGGGFGEGGFGEGPFGGGTTVILTSPTTTWTDIGSP